MLPSVRFCFVLVVAVLMMCGAGFAGEDSRGERPDILIIMADDATYQDLPLYGGTNVRTPHIDRLADEGLTFDRAYLTMSMCQPCRSELYTGQYPATNGCCWNHSPSRSGTRSIVHYLGELGYRVGIAGKIHVQPREVYPFERVPGVTRGAVDEKAEIDTAGMRRFMSRDADEPFCLVVGFNMPHVPWTVGDPDRFDEEALELPPDFVDTPQTREDYAKYLAEIAELDRQIGLVLETLEDAGRAEETLVLFTSEQGAQFPGAKWTNWERGVHTGLVVRWPGRVEAGGRTDALVQYVDVLPTLLDAAGGESAAGDFDGSSFLPVLLGEAAEHRDYAYFMHNNVPEGPPYPIRSVTDGRYHYIRNLQPDRTYIEKHMMGRPSHNPYWSSWMFASADDEHAYRMVRRYMHRPAEHLYDTRADPYEMENLAGDAEHAAVKRRLSGELDRWMRRQGDPGEALDAWEQLSAARNDEHFEPDAAGAE